MNANRETSKSEIIADLLTRGYQIDTNQEDFFCTHSIANSGPGAKPGSRYRICYTWEGWKWEGFTSQSKPRLVKVTDDRNQVEILDGGKVTISQVRRAETWTNR